MKNTTQDTVNEIIEKVDIVDVVSEFVTLEKKGKNYFGLCPFHNENTPSFSVSPEKKIYHCFSCGEGGNVITFLQKLENKSFIEVISHLAEKSNIKININKPYKKEDKYTKYYDINEKVLNFYSFYLQNVNSGKKALEYLHKRGLSLETIKMFDIGFSPHENNLLYKTFTEKGIEPLDLIDLSLVGKNDNYFDIFRNRIIFPIKNEDGKVVAFSGRILKDDSTEPKYINSPQSPIFFKSRILYNLNNASLSIRKNKRAVLFEGFMDVIAASNAGIHESVASMGTSLTDEQAKLLRKYTENVIICYDGDNAGYEASHRAISVLDKHNFNIKIVILPKGFDPDDYIKTYSKEKFVIYLDSSQIDKYEYIYRYKKSKININNFFEVEKFKFNVFEMINKTNSSTYLEIYQNKLAEDINVSVESIKSDFEQFYRNKGWNKIQTKKSNDKIVIQDKFQKSEIYLIRYMLDGEDAKNKIISRLGEFFANNELNRHIVMKILDTYEQKEGYNYSSFYDSLNNDQRIYFDKQIKTSEFNYSEDELNDCIEVMEKYPKIKEKEDIELKIKESSDKKEIIELAVKRDNLKK